jgi:hypothetical protein
MYCPSWLFGGRIKLVRAVQGDYKAGDTRQGYARGDLVSRVEGLLPRGKREVDIG